MATCQQTVLWTPLNSLLSIGWACGQATGKQVVLVVLEQNSWTGAQSPKPEMCFQNGKRWLFHLPDMEEVWIHWATLILGTF